MPENANRRFFDITSRANSGVVDQDVDLARFLQDLLEGICNGIVAVDVKLHDIDRELFLRRNLSKLAAPI